MTRLRTFVTMLLALIVMGVAADNKKFTLVIDAGHGGHDAGAVGKISKEKDINLAVALAFGRLVEQKCSDVKVIYTRKTDVFVELQERANIANRAKADLFISVHTNAVPAGKVARGFEIYALGMHRAADNLAVAKRENSVIMEEKDYKKRYQGFDPKSSESYIMFEFLQDHNMQKSVDLCQFIDQEVCSYAGRINKGVHQAGFLVLRATSMPSCLIELGFISTPDEEQFLNSPDGQQKMATGIFNGFQKYRKRYDEAYATPFVPTRRVEVTQQQGSGNREVARVQPVQPRASRTVVSQEPAKPAAAGAAQPAKPAAQPQPAKPAPAQPAKPVAQPQPAKPAPAQPAKPVAQPQPAKPAPAQPAKPVAQPQPAKPAAAGTAQPAKPAAAGTAQPVPQVSSASGIVFRIQIASSQTLLPKNDQQFRALADVAYYRDGDRFKYVTGNFSTYKTAAAMQAEIRKSIPDAFVVAFRDGKRIDAQEARKATGWNK